MFCLNVWPTWSNGFLRGVDNNFLHYGGADLASLATDHLKSSQVTLFVHAAICTRHTENRNCVSLLSPVKTAMNMNIKYR